MTDLTIAGGIRHLIIEGGRFNSRVWVDDAPAGATMPYVTIVDAISTGTELIGDGGNQRVFVREIQVDLWEDITEEDAALTQGLYADLHGKPVPATDDPTPSRHPATKTKLFVRDVQRLPEPDTRIAHRALTLAVRHDPTGL